MSKNNEKLEYIVHWYQQQNIKKLTTASPTKERAYLTNLLIDLAPRRIYQGNRKYYNNSTFCDSDTEIIPAAGDLLMPSRGAYGLREWSDIPRGFKGLNVGETRILLYK